MNRLAAFASIVALAGTIACAQTDAGVTSKVKAKLAADDIVKATDVNVTTNDHVVTLTGEVQSAAAKEQAVRLTRQTEGVRDVVDGLVVVATSGTAGRSDGIGDSINDGARATGKAIERGAEATGEAVKDAGKAVQDAVTDDDRDSDKDGK
ncbi:MAG TPA: BON domain-containing protein [Vicinamibacterales bacterium]|nr:BON domain-containing protein [Vicinamibacterales bacterium]